MFYNFLPYPRTHMPAAEASAQLASYELRGTGAYELRGLDAYELRGVGNTQSGSTPPPSSGSNPPSTAAAAGAAVGFGAAMIASFVAPILVGYGVHKRGHGLGMAVLAWLGSGFIISPVAYLLPGGSILTTGAAAYYAFKD